VLPPTFRPSPIAQAGDSLLVDGRALTRCRSVASQHGSFTSPHLTTPTSQTRWSANWLPLNILNRLGNVPHHPQISRRWPLGIAQSPFCPVSFPPASCFGMRLAVSRHLSGTSIRQRSPASRPATLDAMIPVGEQDPETGEYIVPKQDLVRWVDAVARLMSRDIERHNRVRRAF